MVLPVEKYKEITSFTQTDSTHNNKGILLKAHCFFINIRQYNRDKEKLGIKKVKIYNRENTVESWLFFNTVVPLCLVICFPGFIIDQ